METQNKNFEELLENYLDAKKIERKKQFDDEEIAKEEKKLAIARGLSEDYTISIHRFLKEYLHTRSTELTKVNLRALKYLGFPTCYVMAVDGKMVKNNPELVEQGYLLIVKDPEHNRGVYINPRFISKLLDKDIIEFELKKFSNPQTIDLEELNDYYDEYQELLQEKAENDTTYEIIKRAHKVKKYNRLKEMLRKSDNND